MTKHTHPRGFFLQYTPQESPRNLTTKKQTIMSICSAATYKLKIKKNQSLYLSELKKNLFIAFIL